MRNKKYWLPLLAVSVFASWLFCAKNAGAVISFQAYYDQPITPRYDYSLQMRDSVKPVNVVLDQWKINFYKACENSSNNRYSVSFSGEAANSFECVHHSYGNGSGEEDLLPFTDENFGDHYSIATKASVIPHSGTGTKSIGGSITINSEAAATDVQTRAKYDVEFTIDSINLKYGYCDSKDGPDTRAFIAWGVENVRNTSMDTNGRSEFAGAHLVGHSECRVGAKFNVSMRLKDAAGNYVHGKTMIWAVTDIDIGDRWDTEYGGKVYDSSHTYAEHIKVLGGMVETPGYPNSDLVSMVSNNGRSELGIADGNTLYHQYMSGGSVLSKNGNTQNNSTGALFRVNMDEFKFEWGGTQCGTTLTNAPSTLYTGRSELFYNGSLVGNTYAENPVIVNGPTSSNVQFKHYIKRENEGNDGAENESFKLSYNMADRDGEDSNGSPVAFSKGEEKLVRDTGGFSVSLNPGQTKTYWQNLNYLYSNVSYDWYASVGVHKIKLQRPYAKFSGVTTATMTKNSGTSVSIPSNHIIDLTDSDNGHYEVTFNNKITRQDDARKSAGGTVKTQYQTSYRVPNTVPGASTVTWSSGAATSGEVNTNALADGGGARGTQSFSAKASGTLKYGETRTVCYTMKYRAVQTSNNALTTATNSEYCVTIRRPMKKCDLDPNYSFGLVSGKNIAQLSVMNQNLNTSARTAIGVATSNVSIYARPSDNIRFSYNMCAGALYPIRENGIHGSHPVTYKASGWSSKNSTVNNNNKSLFRTDVSVANNTYNNPRTWSSASPVGNFLKDSNPDNLIGSFFSPSSGAGEKYHCGSNAQSGWYQVAGRENCNRHDYPEYDVGVLDVGNTITQRLEWNEQSVTNGTTVSSASRTATANVVVPYNYVLKPYITNSAAANRVAYLGETVHMTPGVVVAKRKNSAVSNQTYATITKKTNIRVDYYYTDSTGVTIKKSPLEVYSKDNLRLNNESNLNGTGDSEAYLESGGSKINPAHANSNATNFNIPVNDSILSPGDRVCMRISVWPVDSHDNPNVGTVGVEAISLSESGAGKGSARTTTSCLTVAKRPVVSVEGSNAYSATTIKTSQFNKELGDTKFRFGSWSEYGVYARVDTGSFIFASGAALGYNRSGYKNGSGEWLKSLNAVRDNPSGSDNVSTTNNSTTCTYMTQTFANADCQAGTKNVGGVAADQFSDRMISRYGQGGPNTVSVGTVSLGGKEYMNLSGYSDGGVVDDSGAIVIRSSGDSYIGSNWSPNIDASVFAEKEIINRNKTVVYSMPSKTLVIGGNINAQNGALTSAGQASGVVIVADKVLITSEVTYINATIIANEVNTCAFAGGAKVSFSDLKWTGSDSRACAKSLQFDAPVSTKRIILNRTAGANNGSSSVVRAEVFNFNQAQLLWSYNQMARYNQAITTFSRELPPRY